MWKVPAVPYREFPENDAPEPSSAIREGLAKARKTHCTAMMSSGSRIGALFFHLFGIIGFYTFRAKAVTDIGFRVFMDVTVHLFP